MTKTKRTKKPVCKKASAYACGFSCITMTKTCRQELTGQSIEIASLFANLITDAPKAEPKAKAKKAKTLEQIMAKQKRPRRLANVESKEGNIVYKIEPPKLFKANDIAKNDLALSGEELASQLQDWNGYMFEISWEETSQGKVDRASNDARANLSRALEARRAWPEVLAKLKPGTLLYNTPVPDSTLDSSFDEYKNTRARLYERSGFGKLEYHTADGYDEHPRQYAIVQADGTLRPVRTVTDKGIVENTVKYAEAD